MPNIRKMQEASLQDCYTWFPSMKERSTPSEMVLHFALGLAGETGEVIELIKKANRKGDIVELVDREKLGAEMSDVLMYIFDMAEILSIDLAEQWNAKRVVNQARFEAGGWGG